MARRIRADALSTRDNSLWGLTERAANAATGGRSRAVLQSPEFTAALNAVDSFFAGVADSLTAGLSTRLRGAMWGEAATRNHSGFWFTAGQITGAIISIPMMAANPCSMGAIASIGMRAINGMQLIGNGISALENIAAGNYLSAGLNILGMVGNLSAMARACFTGDMEIQTRRGWVRWDALAENDEVLSCDENDPNGGLSYKPIELLMRTEASIWHVHVKGQIIRTTSEHPFFVWGKGWIAAKDLQIGDLLRSSDGQFVAVGDMLDTGVVEPVYNCSIAEYHTYFVGQEGWGFSVWAHNSGCRVVASTRVADAQITRVINKLRAAIPGMARGRLAIAVAKVKDANGNIKWLVSISGPNGKIPAQYMRIIKRSLPRGARIEVAYRHHPRATYGATRNGLDDAERHILRTLRRENGELIGIGATNNICDTCMAAIRRFPN